jgi:hypothetical protein
MFDKGKEMVFKDSLGNILEKNDIVSVSLPSALGVIKDVFLGLEANNPQPSIRIVVEFRALAAPNGFVPNVYKLDNPNKAQSLEP